MKIKKFNKYIKEKNNELTREEMVDYILNFENSQDDATIVDSKYYDKLSDEQIEYLYNKIYKKNESTATTATVGSGTAVGGGAEGSFTSSAGQATYGGDSGTAFATNSNTAGMGSVSSPQPSDIPGDVSGSVAGSGDIGYSIGTYSKSSPKKKKKKKKTKSKKDRDYIKKASVIDKYYTTKYTEKYEDGKIITKWETFNEIKNTK